MMSVKDLRAWIDTLDPDNMVAVDDGGLTLVELTLQGEPTDAYMEVGGIPEDDPDMDPPSP